MGMAIYLSYLLLEVVMLIRITILNIFNRIDLIEQKQIIHLVRLENCSPTGSCTGWTGLASKVENEEVRGVYRLVSLYSDVVWK